MRILLFGSSGTGFELKKGAKLEKNTKDTAQLHPDNLS